MEEPNIVDHIPECGIDIEALFHSCDWIIEQPEFRGKLGQLKKRGMAHKGEDGKWYPGAAPANRAENEVTTTACAAQQTDMDKIPAKHPALSSLEKLKKRLNPQIQHLEIKQQVLKKLAELMYTSISEVLHEIIQDLEQMQNIE